MKIFQARKEHIHSLVSLYDQYRQFYQRPSDIPGAEAFLRDRIDKSDSVIFLAGSMSRVTGFIQMYPSHSSVAMQPIWILNDLFVDRPHRKKGIARQLMQRAVQHAEETGAARIALATQVDNRAAKHLYEKLGYIRDELFDYYSLAVK
jgi:GNAT superfamily N-acetyltransferase